MSNHLLLKCTNDTEGCWIECEKYPARVVAGGFVLVDDDEELDREQRSAESVQYR